MQLSMYYCSRLFFNRVLFFVSRLQAARFVLFSQNFRSLFRRCFVLAAFGRPLTKPAKGQVLFGRVHCTKTLIKEYQELNLLFFFSLPLSDKRF